MKSPQTLKCFKTTLILNAMLMANATLLAGGPAAKPVDRKPAFAQLKEVPKNEGGGNIGGSGRGTTFDLATQWCRGNPAVLMSARDRADLAMVGNRVGDAIEYLIAGLNQAKARAEGQDLTGTLSYQMIVMTIDMARAMQNAEAANPSNGEKVVAFLESAYDNIIYTSEKIDVPVYVPHLWGQTFDANVVERNYAQFVKLQLEWLTGHFVQVSGLSNAYYSDFGTRLYLVNLQIVAHRAVSALHVSLLNKRYACTIEILANLAQNLSLHNTGDPIYNQDDRIALNMNMKYVYQVIADLGLENGCY